MTVKRGENASAICHVIRSTGTDLEIIWRTSDSVLVSEGVTQLNNTASQLLVDSVTQTVVYQCVARNSIGNAYEVARIDIVDVPSQPRNLLVLNSRNTITISWEPPITDNGQSLTAYYVTIQERSSAPVVTKVSIDRNSHSTSTCGNLTVTLVAENDCGNSTAVTRAFEVICPPSKHET